MTALLTLLATCLSGAAMPVQPSDGVDKSPDWYYPQWLAEAPYTPEFPVRDTANKYGRYAEQTKTITLNDLIKFHGHFCGGLVASASPAVRVIHPGAKVTHEAAIGSVDHKQLETLMERGLDPEAAVDAIVRGMLD